MVKKYPEEIYIQHHEELNGEDNFHLCHEEIADLDDGEMATYKLVKIGKKSTNPVLE